MRVGHYGWQCFVDLRSDSILLTRKSYRAGQRFRPELAKIDFHLLGLTLPGKPKEILHHTVRPLRLLEELADEVLCAFVNPSPSEKLGVAENCG